MFRNQINFDREMLIQFASFSKHRGGGEPVELKSVRIPLPIQPLIRDSQISVWVTKSDRERQLKVIHLFFHQR